MSLHNLRELGVIIIGLAIFASAYRSPTAPSISRVRVADNGDGTYKNPILYADYSDPDAIRVGDDFYLTSSSFNSAPGLPILHSKDLVNWKIIGHALTRQPPFDVFNKPQHGNGVWAPTIRYHDSEFYIFYPDPDYGIYMIKARDATGPWSEPLLIKQAKGWIDPCPFWDDDGQAYLINAFAASRSGIKSMLTISRMAPDGMKLLSGGTLVFDGHDKNPTTEGPKLYKRNGYYYIFAPAGGVEQGWQLVLRSKNIFGPYEQRVVLAQGRTDVNGPHQGAWVDTQTGESWFIHFQDMGAYGRIVHLQPLKWINDWPVIGNDPDGDGTGEPVRTYKKPNVGNSFPIETPQESDEFDGNKLGVQWQWQANPESNWVFPSSSMGILRLFCVIRSPEFRNFWDMPNLLLQKFPAPSFTATTKVRFLPQGDGDKIGLVVMGSDYAYVAAKKTPDNILIQFASCKDADKHSTEKESAGLKMPSDVIYFRVQVGMNALCKFSYSSDGNQFVNIGELFEAKKGRWIGARIGIFATGLGNTRESGYADFDWFRIE